MGSIHLQKAPYPLHAGGSVVDWEETKREGDKEKVKEGERGKKRRGCAPLFAMLAKRLKLNRSAQSTKVQALRDAFGRRRRTLFAESFYVDEYEDE